ncbi:MAG: hypothetical protein M1833_000354 [Piccolia ochrophora]|nr:MAG: hypothetical protein M1833_000354 [Piccolia ochrophora]
MSWLTFSVLFHRCICFPTSENYPAELGRLLKYKPPSPLERYPLRQPADVYIGFTKLWGDYAVESDATGEGLLSIPSSNPFIYVLGPNPFVLDISDTVLEYEGQTLGERRWAIRLIELGAGFENYVPYTGRVQDSTPGNPRTRQMFKVGTRNQGYYVWGLLERIRSLGHHSGMFSNGRYEATYDKHNAVDVLKDLLKIICVEGSSVVRSLGSELNTELSMAEFYWEHIRANEQPLSWFLHDQSTARGDAMTRTIFKLDDEHGIQHFENPVIEKEPGAIYTLVLDDLQYLVQLSAQNQPIAEGERADVQVM